MSLAISLSRLQTTWSVRSLRLIAVLIGWSLAATLGAAESAEPAWSGFIATATATSPRQSEGDIVVLKDGTLLAAWSDFYEKASDHAPARISASRSTDGGRTWGPRFTLQENTGQTNVMSATLLRSRTGDILFFYLRKNSLTDLKVYVRRSSDEAKTWSEPVLITPEEGYHVMNNARVIQLRSGRLLVPVATTRQVGTKNDDFKTMVYYSDDDGRGWQRGRTALSAPKRGAMEPGLIELRDGRVQQIIRTQTGFIWQSFSSDGGDTWSDAQPSEIVSPESPATLARIPGSGHWLLVLNPTVVWGNPERTHFGANHGGPRRPFVAVVSRDEGKTWGEPRVIESDPSFAHAYTSITFDEDRALLTYYEYSEKTKMISFKFKSLPLTSLDR